MKFGTGIIIPIIILFSFLEAKSENRKNNKIIFLSDRDQSNRTFDLFLMDLDSLKTTNLTSRIRNVVIRSSSLPKINAKRNSVFFISFNPRNLVELNLATRAVKKITDIRYEATDYCISSDGHSVVYTEKEDSTLQLFGIDLVHGEKRNLSNNRFNNFEASYSPDGSKIVYVCDQDRSNSISIMNQDGSGQKILTNAFGDDRCPNFSPDGKKIVFSSSRGGLNDSDYDLYMIDSTGRNFSLFHDSDAFDTQPVFSPDNRFVAFLSNARGHLFRDIFLKDIHTGHVKAITFGLKYFNQNFIISPDSRFIVFENLTPDNSEIMMVVISQEQVINLTRHPSRDVSPSL